MKLFSLEIISKFSSSDISGGERPFKVLGSFFLLWFTSPSSRHNNLQVYTINLLEKLGKCVVTFYLFWPELSLFLNFEKSWRDGGRYNLNISSKEYLIEFQTFNSYFVHWKIVLCCFLDMSEKSHILRLLHFSSHHYRM